MAGKIENLLYRKKVSYQSPRIVDELVKKQKRWGRFVMGSELYAYKTHDEMSVEEELYRFTPSDSSNENKLDYFFHDKDLPTA